MSNYDNDADKAEQQLNNISDTMCYAKWAQTSLHLTNGKTHSCYHPPVHDIDPLEIQTDPSALHNTQQKKQERELMLQGIRPKGCEYCWKIEDAGGRSDRVYRSGEYWAQNSRKDIITSTQTGIMNPRYVEVNFNQACNFKCVYCSPHLSTTWEDEIKQHGAFELEGTDGNVFRHNDTEYLARDGMMPLKVPQKDNPYVEAFWQWWPDLYETLEVFRMTGGEPLMDVNTYKVLDYIYENPNAWLELSITTNLCPPKPELWDKFLEKMIRLEEYQIWESKRFNPGSGNHWYVNMATKNNALFVSVDSVGEQAEYIRTGLDFTMLDQNAEEFLDKTCNTTLTIINTYNLMSVPGTLDFIKYVFDLRNRYSREAQGIKKIPVYDPNHDHPDREIHPRQRIWFDVPLLRYPDWLAIYNLPNEHEHHLKEAIEFMKAHPDEHDNFVGFYDFEIDKMERNLAWMKEQREVNYNNIDLNRKNFVNYIHQLDQRRNTKFTEVFPDLAVLLSIWNK